MDIHDFNLPPLNLKPVDELQQKKRRRSLDDMKQKRQHDYEELIKELGMNVTLSHQQKNRRDQKPKKLDPLENTKPRVASLEEAETAKLDVESPPKQLMLSQSTDHFSPVRRSFYDKFSNNSLLNDPQKSSPTSVFVQKARNLNIVPDGIISRVIHSVNDHGNIALGSSVIGDDLALALSKSIELMLGVYTVDISSNHVSDKGISAIINSLDGSLLRSLNCSHSKFKKKAIEALAGLVAGSTELSTLILDDTMMTDNSLRLLSEALKTTYCDTNGVKTHYSTLQVLSLGNNCFCDAGAIELSKVLPDLNFLRELDLSWNQIRNAGGKSLFKILNGTNIEQLDIGNNALSKTNGEMATFDRQKDEDSASCIADVLRGNMSLTHLSLSHSNFGEEECKTIGSGLVLNNFTLLGLHMDGNCMGLNDNGELISVEGGAGKETGVVFSRIMAWANPNINTDEKWAGSSKCWICEKYNEKKFSFDLRNNDVGGPEEVETCHLTCNFDHWSLSKMNRVEPNVFELYKMCPPIDIGYCFQVEFVPGIKTQEMVVYASDQPVKDAVEYHDNAVNFSNRMFALPKEVNTVVVEPRGTDFDDMIRVQPRKRLGEGDGVVHNSKGDNKLEWVKRNSVFAALKDAATQDKLASKNDLSKSKQKDSIENVDEMESLYSTHFPILKQIYKHYAAAFSTSTEIFSIGASSFGVLLSDMKVIEGEGGKGEGGFIRKADADLIFVGCSTRKNLSRVQFIDALFALAKAKFPKTHSLIECFNAFMEEHVLNNCVVFNKPDTFRERRLFNLR